MSAASNSTAVILHYGTVAKPPEPSFSMTAFWTGHALPALGPLALRGGERREGGGRGGDGAFDVARGSGAEFAPAGECVRGRRTPGGEPESCRDGRSQSAALTLGTRNGRTERAFRSSSRFLRQIVVCHSRPDRPGFAPFMIQNVLVLGAGSAGLLAAITLKKNSRTSPSAWCEAATSASLSWRAKSAAPSAGRTGSPRSNSKTAAPASPVTAE